MAIALVKDTNPVTLAEIDHGSNVTCNVTSVG
jgi:hypothetical protein